MHPPIVGTFVILVPYLLKDVIEFKGRRNLLLIGKYEIPFIDVKVEYQRRSVGRVYHSSSFINAILLDKEENILEKYCDRSNIDYKSFYFKNTNLLNTYSFEYVMNY